MSRPTALQISDPVQQDVTDMKLGTPSHICGLPNRDVCIADSQNHCLWVVSSSGKIKYRIGTGNKGNKNGHLRDSEFSSPQAMVVFHNSLFVADTGNNEVREVSLKNASVLTMPKSVASPVDIYEFQEKLFIISSGQSKINCYDPLRHQFVASFDSECKQPSGLATNGELLFYTDLATSSIKAWDGKTVQTLYTPASPTDLNKPMGLSYSGNKLYIADTYNHQIKSYSIGSKNIEPLAGIGKAGNQSGPLATAALNYPTSLFVTGMSIFVCDRGNNQIKFVDLLQARVHELKVQR